MSEEEGDENPLRGQELLEKIESFEEEECLSLQERMCECNYEEDYWGYFKAVASARDEDLEFFEFTTYDQFEIPYIALEVGKVAKLEDFYVEIISSLIKKKIDLTTAYAVIKKLALKVSYKDKYESGFITDYVDLDIADKDARLIGKDLIKKITNDKNELVYSPEMITECGYQIFDDDGNDNPSVIEFYEEVINTLDINIKKVDISSIDLNSLAKEIEIFLNIERLPFLVETVAWDNIEDLEAYYLCDAINFKVQVIDPSEFDKSKNDAYQQEFKIVKTKEDKNFGLMPSGEYFIGGCPFGESESINEYLYLLRDKGPFSTENEKNFIVISTKYGDGEFLDNKFNSYPIGGGSIPCFSTSLVEDEDAESYSDSISLQEFSQPFECNWFENGGYIQYGEIWIQTDSFDNFFVPTKSKTLLGRAALSFGQQIMYSRFFPNDDEQESNYWRQLSIDIDLGGVIDKTMQEIFSLKATLVTEKIDPELLYKQIIDNFGINRSAEAFYKIFKGFSDLDDDETDEKLLNYVDTGDSSKIEIPDIPKLSSLNLEKHPEIVKDRSEANVSAVMSQVGSKLRKELWPEGQVASDYWTEIATIKEKEGDHAYAELSTLMAKLHMREMSGDAVFTAGQKFEDNERYRIYKDMADNRKWFVQINQSDKGDN